METSASVRLRRVTIIASYACNSAQMVSNQSSSITLFCSFGTLNEITDFGQTLAAHNVTCKGDDQGFKFTPKTCSYYSGLQQSSIARIDQVFKEKCYDKTNCTFPLDSLMITSNCTSGLQPKDLVYFMQAGCSSDYIYLFGSQRPIEKSTLGLIIVCFDIFIVILLFCFLQF